MRILLVYPPIMRSVGIYSTPLPIGMLHVASYLACSSGFTNDVKCLNLEVGDNLKRTVSIKEIRGAYRDNNPSEYIADPNSDYRIQFRQAVKDFNPDVIGFSCATEQAESADVLACDAKEIDLSIQVVYGGVHYLGTKNHMWGNRIEKFARDYEPAVYMLKGQNPPESFGSVLTSYGCPHKCTFCSSPKIYGRRVYNVPMDKVKNRIEKALKMGATKVHLMDDMTTMTPSRASKLASLMGSIGVPWRTQTRVDDICRDKGFVEYFKKNGCTQLTFGVESGSPSILKKMKKGITPEQVLNAVKILNDADMPYTANFIVGYPGETDYDVQHTIDLIDEMKPRRLLGGSFVPYKDTEAASESINIRNSLENYPFSHWSPFNPHFLCDADGNRIDGPSKDMVDKFYDVVEQVNSQGFTKGTFSAVSDRGE